MARIACMLDAPMQKLGLSGKSFVPVLIGFGCSVPAIMASRTLADRKERIMTMLLIPFVSCSAKLPIYGIFCMTFFQEKAVFVMMALYLLGLSLGSIAAFILKALTPKTESVPFLMELPSYRVPSCRNLVMLSYEKAKDYIQKALTIIFLGSFVIWFLETHDVNFHVTQNIGESLLAKVGMSIAFLFYPLGFKDWRICASLLTGLSAKEAVLSTLAVHSTNLYALFTPLSAFSFLVFVLLYSPCVATLRIMSQEMLQRGMGFIILITQTAIAWLFSLIVYQLGCLLM